jgi:hypothetical protein
MDYKYEIVPSIVSVSSPLMKKMDSQKTAISFGTPDEEKLAE